MNRSLYIFLLLLLFYNVLIFVCVFGSNVKLVLEGVLFLSTCCKGRIGLFLCLPFNCMTLSELLLFFLFFLLWTYKNHKYSKFNSKCFINYYWLHWTLLSVVQSREPLVPLVRTIWGDIFGCLTPIFIGIKWMFNKSLKGPKKCLGLDDI